MFDSVDRNRAVGVLALRNSHKDFGYHISPFSADKASKQCLMMVGVSQGNYTLLWGGHGLP
jgi:hypothetical protein